MSIQVTNLSSGETVTYSLPILVGEVTPPLTQGHIKVTCFTERRARLWPICNGQFKILVPLQKGENRIELHFFDETIDFVLHYQVPQIKKYVRPIYIKPNDHEGLFQGPDGEDTSVENATKRIALAAKLIQSFTAEKLHEHGLGRKTFVLESDLYPSCPACHVFTSKMCLKRARETSGGDLWMSFARELMSSKLFKEKENVKWYAFMSFTHYSPPEGVVPKSHSEVIRYTQGHTALGGGGLALFGTGNLHTWASSIEEFVSRFTDTRKIDRSKLMDDSAYRQYHWANYSTGLGASLHELGHTFDLAHTPTGIMSRGFDDIYRTFLAQPMTISRESSSRDSSRLASPIPYSPKESPVHRPRRKESLQEQKSGSGSRSSSPKPCPLSRPPQARSGVAMMPSVIQIETAFRRVAVENTQTLTVHNYDGSQTKKTITRNKDGTETISEVTTYPDGKQIAREMIKHVASGKTRTTMSMGTNLDRNRSDKNSSSTTLSRQPSESQPHDISTASSATNTKAQAHTSQSAPVSDAKLFKVPVDGAKSSDSSLSFQEIKYKDGGAHWYRSSAVMLASHKWFNEPRRSDPRKPPDVKNGVVKATGDRGLRLIELRSLPEGVVFHHWEFLQDHPPTAFILRHSEIMHLSHNASQITVVAEDDYGNIIKKKIVVADLDRPCQNEKTLVVEGTTNLEGHKKEEIGVTGSEKGSGPNSAKNNENKEEKTHSTDTRPLVSNGFDAFDSTMQSDISSKKGVKKKVCEEDTDESISRAKSELRSNSVAGLNSIGVTNLKPAENISGNRESTSESNAFSEEEILPLKTTIQNSEIAAEEMEISLKPSKDPPSNNSCVQVSEDACTGSSLAKTSPDCHSKLEKHDSNKNVALSDARSEVQYANNVEGQQHSISQTQDISIQGINSSTSAEVSDTSQIRATKRLCVDDRESGTTLQMNGSVSPGETDGDKTESDDDVDVLTGDMKLVVANGIVASTSGSHEEAMETSKESGDSDEVQSSLEKKVNILESDVDNFSKNKQHNIAVQQTVESNHQEDADEMVQSLHMENGNTDL